MKTIRFISLLAVCIAMSGCSATPQQVNSGTQGVLTATQIACVIGKLELPNSKAVAEACNIAQELTPIIEEVESDVVGSNKAYAAKQMAAARCASSDAGK